LLLYELEKLFVTTVAGQRYAAILLLSTASVALCMDDTRQV